MSAAVSPTKSDPPVTPPIEQPSLWSQLLTKMHPKTCLAAIDSELPLDVAVPMIYGDLHHAQPKKQKQAVQKLYQLTDQKHRHFR